MPKHRMPRGLVALSASAVTAIYLAGYVRTQGADASLDVAQTVAIASPAASPTLPPFGGRSTLPRPGPTPTVAPPASALKDGTFSGQGSSRRGGVWVNVVIQGGRIASVTITKSTLQYPVRDIAGLPDVVVQRQSANVDVVSGATYSTQAFRAAVTEALAAARG